MWLLGSLQVTLQVLVSPTPEATTNCAWSPAGAMVQSGGTDRDQVTLALVIRPLRVTSALTFTSNGTPMSAIAGESTVTLLTDTSPSPTTAMVALSELLLLDSSGSSTWVLVTSISLLAVNSWNEASLQVASNMKVSCWDTLTSRVPVAVVRPVITQSSGPLSVMVSR